VVDELRARAIDPLVFAGGIISGPDIEALKAHGVAEVFTPGSPLDTITDWLEARSISAHHNQPREVDSRQPSLTREECLTTAPCDPVMQ
jgi:hypothetical protein